MTMRMKISIPSSLEHLLIDDKSFDQPVTLAAFEEVLGHPERTWNGTTPAPVGHRNNQFHYYDSLGLYLSEHHMTTFILSLDVVFESVACPHPPLKTFHSELLIGNSAVYQGMLASDFVSNCPIPFRPHFEHWHADGEVLSVDIRVLRPTTASGHRTRSKHLRIGWVSIYFR